MAKKEHKPSPRQKAIYDATRHSRNDIAVVATAGSGKTTTLLGLLDFAPRTEKSIFLSFSSAIIEELKTKVPAHIPARTLHSLGFEMMRNYFRGVKLQVNKEKYFFNALDLYREAKGGGKPILEKSDYRGARMVEQVCAYIRMTLTPHSDEQKIREMCAYYAIECNDDVLKYSQRLMRNALVSKTANRMWIDFVDMIYFPVKIPAMIDRTFDTVYLDEAQDTNDSQRMLVEAILGKKGRLISVGDDWQCIYGFQGANIHSFEKLRERPNTVTLPLDVTYRCPIVVVNKVKKLFPDANIEAAPGAPRGEEKIGNWTDIKEGDMVLSRITKPLIELYFELVATKVKAQVVGKDIEKGLLDLAETIMAPTKEGLIIKMNHEFEKLQKQLEARGITNPFLQPSYEALEEKFQLLSVILRNVDNKTSKLIPTIHEIFNVEKVAARLMTIHRAKGLESERVFIVTKYKGERLMPHKRAVLEWQKIQERNLQFVAYTRTKFGLYYLELNPKEVSEENQLEE